MLADLGLRVGDELELHGGKETEAGFEPITESVTIVGTGVLPIGDGAFERTLALSYEGMRRLAPDVEPQLIVIDLAPSADRPPAQAALASSDSASTSALMRSTRPLWSTSTSVGRTICHV